MQNPMPVTNRTSGFLNLKLAVSREQIEHLSSGAPTATNRTSWHWGTSWGRKLEAPLEAKQRQQIVHLSIGASLRHQRTATNRTS